MEKLPNNKIKNWVTVPEYFNSAGKLLLGIAAFVTAIGTFCTKKPEEILDKIIEIRKISEEVKMQNNNIQVSIEELKNLIKKLKIQQIDLPELHKDQLTKEDVTTILKKFTYTSPNATSEWILPESKKHELKDELLESKTINQRHQILENLYELKFKTQSAVKP